MGGACVAAPHAVLDLIGGPDRDDELTLVVARVLGLRLVAQAAADLVVGDRVGRRLRALGVAVDLTHAASMLPVAARCPEHRRSALVSAAAAAATAALDLRPRRA
jgi:hypothetical protein